MNNLLCNNTIFLFFFIGLATLAACGNDAVLSDEELIGRWDLAEAQRNQRVTTSISGLFFEFTPEGQMVTNLSGEEEKTNYELDENTILQEGGSMNVELQIVSLSNDTLKVLTEIQDSDFRFMLIKAKLDS